MPRIAYIMSRFPKLTETFVLYEILGVQRRGIDVGIFPLQREKVDVMHDEARELVESANFTRFLSWDFLPSHLHFAVRSPWKYFKTIFDLVRCNLGSRRYLGGAIAFFPKAVHFARLMQRDGIQHVHAHFASHPAAVAFVIRRLTNIPFSFTAHGSDLHRDKHMLEEKVAESAFVVAIAEFNRQIIIKHCGDRFHEKVKVVHCGVDPSEFTPNSRTLEDSSRLSITCIGTLHEVKGQTFLVQACAKLRDRGIAFHLHLVGDGCDLQLLRKQVDDLQLEDMVTFHGRLRRDQVSNVLQSTDIIVTPSVPSQDGRREGIPVAIMEGMATQIPVIASDLSGIPELVQDDINGLLVPPRDVDKLCDALYRLADEPDLRQRLAKEGRRTIERKFSLDQNVESICSLFRQSIGGNGMNAMSPDDEKHEVKACL